MSDHEVDRMLGAVVTNEDDPKMFVIDFRPGDQVKVNAGPFETFDGIVESVDESSGSISVLIEIFGRPTPVDFEYHELDRS